MTGETFVCARCGATELLGDESDALAELERNFPGVDLADCGLTCDACYAAILAGLAGMPTIVIVLGYDERRN